MRLILITQDFLPTIGGIQTYTFELAKRLSKECEYFCVVAPDFDEASEIDAKLPFNVKRIQSRDTLIGWKAIKVLPDFIREKNVDTIFHAQWTTLPISLIMKFYSIIDKIVVAVHGRELLFNPFEDNFFMRFIYNAYRKVSFIFVDLFLPVSDFTANLLKKDWVRGQKIHVVINGTDPKTFYPTDAESFKKEQGFKDKKILLTTTRLVARKGIDTVLKALPKVVEKHPELLYLVVGDGEYRQNLEKLSEELNLREYVRFSGKVPYADLNLYYNMSDVFVMPSKTDPPDVEGFGLVFLEANACAKPVIGSKSGGIPSAIVHGETGLLVEEENPAELTDAINLLLDDTEYAKELGIKGRKRVLNEANWDSASSKVFALITK